MKFLIVTWLIFSGPLFFAQTTHAKSKASKAPKKNELFLSLNQLVNLNVEDRIEYLEKAMDYVVLAEKILEKKDLSKKSEKHSYLNHIHSFLDLIPTAEAQMGVTCICGTYAGIKPDGKSCQTLPGNKSCGGGKFKCNPAIFHIPQSGGKAQPVCVANASSCSSRSQACLTEFRRLRDSGGMTKDQLHTWTESAGTNLRKLYMTGIGEGTVESRCNQYPGDKDCAALASLKTDIVAAGGKVVTTDDVVKRKEQDARDKNEAYGAPPNTHTPKGLPGVTTPITTGANCVQQQSAKLGSLACVACGLAEAEPDARSGVSEYVALMGVAAQTYDGGPFRTDTANGRQKLLENVIERISTYGYCTDAEYGSGALNSGSSQIRDIIDGQQPMTKSFLFFKYRNKDLTSSVFAQFGVESGRDLRGRAPNSVNDRGRRPSPTGAYAKQIFNYQGDRGQTFHFPTGVSPAPRRQQHYQAQTTAHYRNFPNNSFSSCTQAMRARGQRNPAFNMCQPRGSKGFDLNQKGYQAHQNLENKLRQACGLPARAKKAASSCQQNCFTSFAFGNGSAWLQNCSPSPDGGRDSSKGGETGPTTGRDPTGPGGHESGPQSGRDGPGTGPGESGPQSGRDAGGGGIQ